jgi:DMSO/TMAO reductase YedYZ molybdopterin-dependent catalytic subunit
MLPAGQIPRPDFPRFGLTRFADRHPTRPHDRSLSVKFPGAGALVLAAALDGLPRTTVLADFHCVTTWSRVGLRWGGVRFSDFVRLRIAPLEGSPDAFLGVVLRAQDGYRTSLWRDDLMADDVLLADELDGEPLSIDHGAPFRLVAPRHYGYKSLKHLTTIEFCAETPRIDKGVSSFLDHPRARVALEERGRWLPGWLLRYVYRPFIPRTVQRFREGLARRERSANGVAPGDRL